MTQYSTSRFHRHCTRCAVKRKQCAVLKKYLAVVAGDEFGRGKHWGCWPFELQVGQRIDLKREEVFIQINV